MTDMAIPSRVADSSTADQVAETASPNGAAVGVVNAAATAVGGGASAAVAVGAGAAAVGANDAFLSMGAVSIGDMPPPTLGQRIEMTGALAVDGLKQLVKPDPKKSEVHQSKMGTDVAEAKTAKSDGWPAEPSIRSPRQQELATKQKDGTITKEENAEYHALNGYPGNERMQQLSIKKELGTITDAELKEFQQGNSLIQDVQKRQTSFPKSI